MRFDVLTIFPEMISGPLQSSILKRAQIQKQLEVNLHNIRDVAKDAHKTVDDRPYGGGSGMVLKVDIIDQALQNILNLAAIQAISLKDRRIILLTPQGQRFQQIKAANLSQKYQQITLICGHYEGFDERIRNLVDEEISIGDYILTGGELAALVLIEAISRLLPTVLEAHSTEEESFSLKDPLGQILLEYPQYTRPLEYRGQKVPDILLSGNHAAIKAWRLEMAISKTKNHASV